MRRRINRRLMGIALFSILATTLAMAVLFYGQLRNQVFSDLAVFTDILLEEGIHESQTKALRITVVEENGEVSYDSAVDAGTLKNHSDRPEIIEALKNGGGKAVRKSNTLSKSIFYYARRMDNGKVLRVGKEVRSVLSVFLPAFPVLLGMAFLLAGLCFLFSHYLTAAILRPIDQMVGDMDNMDLEGTGGKNIYPELIPFTQKIRTQHEEILASANMRQEFTANVTHELKTPLAAISGYAELMEAGLANEADIKHFSKEIRKNAARLLCLINDIIRLSQLDSGNPKEVLELVNLAELAGKCVETLKVYAAKNQVTIFYEGDDRTAVRIGKELAQELVFNLVQNAVRYNHVGGKVWVTVLRDKQGITLSVQDTGIGIPPECQERVFERFYRVDKSRSKELGGTGLGLAIVKHICTITGAAITLTGEPNVGTKVVVLWANQSDQESLSKERDCVIR